MTIHVLVIETQKVSWNDWNEEDPGSVQLWCMWENRIKFDQGMCEFLNLSANCAKPTFIKKYVRMM